MMSGRHQNSTWRAIDTEIVDTLQQVRYDLPRLTAALMELPVSVQSDPAHNERVWANAAPVVRPYLLRRLVQADAHRWGPLLAEAIVHLDDDFGSFTFDELAAVFDLFAVPNAYGVLVYTDPSYAERFDVRPPELPAAAAWCRAFGGSPDPDEHDPTEALRDARFDTATVLELAPQLVVPPMLPALTVEVHRAFEVDPGHLVEVMVKVRDHFVQAATARRAVTLHWHATP